MPLIEQLGMQAAGQAASGILGLALGGINDRRQLKQQGKLGQQQLALNKQMTDYQQMKQLEMWEKTGYGAQKEQMIKAGLNPALLYGMSGGGGQTIGGGAAGVSAPGAPEGGGEAMGMIGMGIQQAAQLALLKAQKENIEADTRNKNADTDNKPKQGANIEADTVLKNLKAQWDNIENEIKNKTKEDAIRTIWYNADKAAWEANIAEGEGQVIANEAVIEARKTEIITRAATMIIEKDIAELSKGKTQEEINKIRQDIKNSIETLKNQTTEVSNSTIRTQFETNLGNRLSMEAVRALGGIINQYIGKKTVDVNK